MSLIHDALKEMEPGPLARSSLPRGPQPRARDSRWPAVAAFFGVLACGAIGLLAWQYLHPPAAPVAPMVAAPAPQPAPPAPVPAAESTPAPAPAPATATASVAATDAPAVAPAPAASAVAPPPPTAAPAVTTASAASPAEPPAKPAAARPAAARPTAARTARAPVAPAPAPAPEEDMPPEKRFALFLQAMKTNDLPAAQTQLQRLRQQMTGSSMTLLRAEAWFALASGDSAGARARYTSLLERLPGDEEASINLASLELREQRVEPARRLLHEALTQNPDSEALKAALARFRDVRN